MRKSILSGIALVLLVANIASAQVPAAERDALIALYDATNGDSWTNRTNWKGEPGTECTWYGVACYSDGPKTVATLELNANNLSGTLPPEIGNLTNLYFLALERNQLTGNVPSTIGNLSALLYLHLAENQLSGPLPGEIGNLSNLEIASLRANQLSGAIPAEIGNLAKLQVLDLGANDLTGSIPPTIGNLTSLVHVKLDVNQLTGSIPPMVGGLSSLQTLDFSRNQLSGSIPAALADLAALKVVYLHGNTLSGSIPSELAGVPQLEVLSLSGNQLSGSIPPTLANLSTLTTLALSSNQLSGPIPPQLGSLSNLVGLDLSANQFSGSIPPELGNLSLLYNFLASANELSGSIPAELGKLSNLVTLELGLNRLTGSIPTELGNLSKLTYLRLSGNHLIGSIEPLASLASVCGGCLSLDFNALYATDAAADSWANARQSDWKSSQTIAPLDVAVVTTTATSAMLTWVPITFTGLTGRYEVWTDAGSGPVLAGVTADKASAGTTVAGLTAGTTYAFSVRTVTDPHTYNQNTVTSEFTVAVAATTLPPNVSIDDVTVPEGNAGTSNAIFNVSLDNPSGASVVVAYATEDASAVAATDYTASNGTLTFNPGETLKQLAIPVAGDTIDEQAETFTVRLSNATNATIVDGEGSATITDDDSSVISIVDASGVEGDAGTNGIAFTVSLSVASASTITVTYATASGTATAGADYVEVQPATVTFAPGETSTTVSIAVLGDTIDESNEAFAVSLSSPVNAAILDGEATGTILDDDGAPQLLIDDVSVGEGGAGIATATFTVTLIGSSASPVEVQWSTADGTAAAGEDYSTARGVLIFASGDHSKAISIDVMGDERVEGDEVFFVNLSAPLNATIGDGQGTATIVDDDVAGDVPHPAIVVDGCKRVGDPCVISARAVANGSIDGWSIRWLLDGVQKSTSAVWPAVITEFGTYRLELVATNAAGSGSVTRSLHVQSADCPASSLCTLDERFEISLIAKDHRTGNTGVGVDLQQNDLFGYFAIPALTFNTENPEVFVKVLDGRLVNGNFWVFYGGLTDLEYTVTVKDLETEETRTYVKPAGSSAGGFDTGTGVSAETCASNVTGVVQTPVTPSACAPGSDRLCLNGSRFQVTLAARDQRTENRGAGVSIPQNDLFGYFAIPALTTNADNPEVFVKVLDGRLVNNSWWIFYGGLTDLEYTLTVTDTMTGKVKTYTKAAGSACGAFDVAAF